MAIDFTCGCGRQYSVADELAGKRTRCPACRLPLIVPVPPAPSPSSEAETFGFQDADDDLPFDPRQSVVMPPPESWNDTATPGASGGRSMAEDAAGFAMSAAQRKEADEKAARDRPHDGATIIDQEALATGVAKVILNVAIDTM